ncbi:hypothetical protein CAOG_02794 [Capsaspora owczarzaki ATCC 30864]|uniref:Uncharacterized protein n=1 Tax=Capsaspora owczarzaki (strain ATCC 30864) TaxID=595528 RepID=A0A0D2WN24_CAPO3|nr:hypothetical protein CAOG_02794 [Capsaspora owczarzaki ATCC 30864]KJE91697.1 hypothetical protein CAOG_002794 [Capsaspora owczarzaki ATCC 30864]KJE91698.1 hypothetical protein, variant [Capsaspora owczarzaki ATCC 30864]|eukprot:XP_004349547.2 hypothetical protein CAOG_02794 [Capsaspora owczarzaki ATCC 30864]
MEPRNELAEWAEKHGSVANDDPPKVSPPSSEYGIASSSSATSHSLVGSGSRSSHDHASASITASRSKTSYSFGPSPDGSATPRSAKLGSRSKTSQSAVSSPAVIWSRLKGLVSSSSTSASSASMPEANLGDQYFMPDELDMNTDDYNPMKDIMQHSMSSSVTMPLPMSVSKPQRRASRPAPRSNRESCVYTWRFKVIFLFLLCLIVLVLLVNPYVRVLL